MEEETKTTRHWAWLPRDVLWEILVRLPQLDILQGAGLVCAAWRRVASEEPTLWRSIHLALDDEERFQDQDLDLMFRRLALARTAVDRSAGGCVSFRGPLDRYLLAYLAGRAPSLRSLHVAPAGWCLPEADTDSVITKLPRLERLVLMGGVFRTPTLRALLKHCPRLEVLDVRNCYTDGGTSYRLWRKSHRMIKILHLSPGPVSDYCRCWHCCLEEQRRASGRNSR